MKIRKPGKVFFVGAGPGGPALLTVRGAQLLRSVDVVVYDDSLDDEFLAEVRGDAERVAVGETAPAVAPDSIPAVLLDRGRRGLRVARLHSGDPMLATNGVQELLFLRINGIEFELVPGVDSAGASPAAAGIPILQPGVAPSVLIISEPVAPPPAATAPPAPAAPVASSPTSDSSARRAGVIIKKKRGGGTSPSQSGVLTIGSGANKVAIEGTAVPGVTAAEAGGGDLWSPDDTALPGVAGGGKTSPARRDTSGLLQPNWQAVARAAETIVFLKPLGCLDAIQAGLLSGGRSGSEPAAAISHGTTPRQHTVSTTIEAMARDIGKARLEVPCVLVVGDCVNLREHLNVFEQRPLFGLKLAVTRARPLLEEACRLFGESGALCLPLPITEPQPVAGLADVLDALRDDLRLATHIVFADETTVDVFFRALNTASLDVRLVPEGCRMLAVGPMTHGNLVRRGLQAGIVREPFDEAELMKSFEKTLKNCRIILLGSTVSHPELVRELHLRGAAVTEVPAYESSPAALHLLELRQALTRGEVDAVTFFSPEEVAAAAEAWGETTVRRLLGDVAVASIDMATTKALTHLGIAPQIEAAKPTLEGMCKQVIRWCHDPSTIRHEKVEEDW